MQLKDKVVAITGGSRGFGRALAEAFIKEGARVSICALNENELQKTAKETSALPVVADVRNENDMQKFADETIKEYGALDIWVNNAGVFKGRGLAENFNMEEIRRMFEINVIGLMHGSRVALRLMKPRSTGIIVNIVSSAALSGREEISMYAASKWAVRGFTESIREENKGSNILILSIFPGGMKTELFEENKSRDYDQYMDPKIVAGKIIANLKKESPETEQILTRATVNA
jgi:NADP-dependent 3-hydroxy acid dehydrogenase YdfG